MAPPPSHGVPTPLCAGSAAPGARSARKAGGSESSSRIPKPCPGGEPLGRGSISPPLRAAQEGPLSCCQSNPTALSPPELQPSLRTQSSHSLAGWKTSQAPLALRSTKHYSPLLSACRHKAASSAAKQGQSWPGGSRKRGWSGRKHHSPPPPPQVCPEQQGAGGAATRGTGAWMGAGGHSLACSGSSESHAERERSCAIWLLQPLRQVRTLVLSCPGERGGRRCSCGELQHRGALPLPQGRPSRAEPVQRGQQSAPGAALATLASP